MTGERMTVHRTGPSAPVGRVRPLREPFRIIRADLRAYLAMNAVVYGLSAAGFVAGLAFPGLAAARRAAFQDGGTTDLVVSLLTTPWLFALTIFAVNTLTAAGAQIVLPSLIVPFAGIAVFGYRAFIVGLTLTPTNRAEAVALIPHSLTILIEFQAYVLVMFGAYLLGRAWLRPGLVDAPNRRQGYLHGVRQLGWLSLPALALFVVGALYEAFSIIYLVPLFLRSWG